MGTLGVKRKKNPNPRRHVIASALVIKGKRAGNQKVWGYCFGDLALLLKMTPGAVRQAVKMKRFDPASLGSIFRFMVERGLEP